ncbi:asb046 [Agrotis segetum nucleopolyhedrovirus B]|uniref:Asb046 n=1 Tax=Agrotis segetum nucleopolyhedrovirus B TaxID=1580580 RepID=A0A0A7KR37_9ABAC|nr:asb046 [Agrotis segetum nucleopolyhedrovirus B]AIZ48604.1 asb046 [Agrotis segetum nucleopolyhedrovirus B]
MAECLLDKIKNFPSERERLEGVEKWTAEKERFKQREKMVLSVKAANGDFGAWFFCVDDDVLDAMLDAKSRRCVLVCRDALNSHSCNQCSRMYNRNIQKKHYWHLMSRDHLFPELAPLLQSLLTQTSVCPYLCKQQKQSHYLFCKPLQCDPVCPVLKTKDLLLADYSMQILQCDPNVSQIESIVSCKSPNPGYVKVPLKQPVMFEGVERSNAYVQSVCRLLQSGFTLDFDFMYLCHLAEVKDFNICSLIDVLMEHDRERWLKRYDFYVLYNMFGMSARHAALKAEAKERNIRPLFHLMRSPTTFFLLTDIKDSELLDLMEAWWAKPDSTLLNCYTHALKHNSKITTEKVMMSSLENVFERLTEYALFDGEHEVVAKFRQHVKGRNKRRKTVSLTLCTSINKIASNKHKFKMCLVYLLGIVPNEKMLSAWFESGFDTAELDYFFDESLSYNDILNSCKAELLATSA